MIRDILKLKRHGMLIRVLVARDLKARYRGSVLGFLWSFLNPLCLMLVYALVFSFYLRTGTDKYAAFLCSGLLPWIWFQSSLMEGTLSIVGGSNLVSKALFPAEVLPLVPVLANLVHFLLGLPILALFLGIYKIVPSWLVVFLPVLLLIQLLLTVGFVLFLATMNVFYRDTQHIVANLLTLWFFLSPIVYESEHVPAAFQWTLKLNPMAYLTRGYQEMFYYHTLHAGYAGFALGLVVLLFLSVALCLGSYWMFLRYKDEFVELV